MRTRFPAALGITAFASALALCLYGAWGALRPAPIPFGVVAVSAAMIAVGIAIGDYLQDAAPQTRWWLVPNVMSLVLSIPLAMPFPFDPGMPLCMVATALVSARVHPLLLSRRLRRSQA